MLPSDEPVERIPVWLITYSDLMTLLLVFFVLLFSLSEFRQTERFQGVAHSLQAKFGPGKRPPEKIEELQLVISQNLRAGHERRRTLTGMPR
jgi:flagellar motor protein MotB